MKTQTWGSSTRGPLIDAKSGEWYDAGNFIRRLLRGIDRADLISWSWGWKRELDGCFGYRNARCNGIEEDSPQRSFPYDGTYTWLTPDNIPCCIRYTEGHGDKAWMEERDWNYIKRLLREGRLLELEPNADKEIVSDHKFRVEITQALEAAKAGCKSIEELEAKKRAETETAKKEVQVIDVLPKMKTQTFGVSQDSFIMVSAAERRPIGAIETPTSYIDFQSYHWPERYDGFVSYMAARVNGDDSDSPERFFPHDGVYTWFDQTTQSRPKLGQVASIRYTEGAGDRAWMEERDRNYLARLRCEEAERQKLKELEPALRAVQSGVRELDKTKVDLQTSQVKVRDLETMLQTTQTERDKIRDELVATKQKVEELEKQLKTAKSVTLEELKRNTGTGNAGVEIAFRDKLLAEMSDRMGAEVAHRDSMLRGIEDTLRVEKERAATENVRLSAVVIAKETECHGLVETKGKLEETLRMTQQKVEELTETAKQKDTALQKIQTEKADVLSRFESAQKEIEKLRTEVRRLTEEKQSVREGQAGAASSSDGAVEWSLADDSIQGAIDGLPEKYGVEMLVGLHHGATMSESKRQKLCEVLRERIRSHHVSFEEEDVGARARAILVRNLSEVLQGFMKGDKKENHIRFTLKENEIADYTKNMDLVKAIDGVLDSRPRMASSFFSRPNIPAPSAPSAQPPSLPQ